MDSSVSELRLFSYLPTSDMDAPLDDQTRFAFPDERHQTPLHRAAWHGKYEQVEEMVRRDASGLNDQDEKGRSPLHYAAMGGHRYTCLIDVILHFSID